MKPVNPKGNQSWIFIGRTDGEAETPILWPLDTKNWLTGKDPDAGKDWEQEKGTTEDEMVGWHHWLLAHEFEQAPRGGDGQGSMMCWSPWGRKESDTTEQLNWTKGQELEYKLPLKKLKKKSLSKTLYFHIIRTKNLPNTLTVQLIQLKVNYLLHKAI